jgi:hypothetical protein
MKFCSKAMAAALLWVAAVSAQDDCPFVEMATPLEVDLSSIDSLMFVGVVPTIISRIVGPPMVRILRHTNDSPRMLMEGTTAMIGKADCITDGTIMTPSSASTYYVNVASFLGMTAGSYLTGVSPAASLGLGLAVTAGAWMPGAHVSIYILSIFQSNNHTNYGLFLTPRCLHQSTGPRSRL